MCEVEFANFALVRLHGFKLQLVYSEETVNLICLTSGRSQLSVRLAQGGLNVVARTI